MIAMIALCIGTVTAQKTSTQEAMPATEHTATADHVCTAACMDGKHAYAHGEKGHACSSDCMKMHGEDAAMKEHVCTDACKDGKHAYACGEKGHTCNADCMAKHAKDAGKPHACTAACKDGKHASAHGEKGHTCNASCKQTMEEKK